MKRFFAFIFMFILFLPDLPWCILNLAQAASLYITGMLFEIVGLKNFGKKVKMYGKNIALSIDQFGGTKGMGQDSDVTISMALGVAKVKHLNKTARVNWFWLKFGDFVNFLFGFQDDHVVEAIERDEKATGTVLPLYVEIDKAEDKTDLAA